MLVITHNNYLVTDTTQIRPGTYECRQYVGLFSVGSSSHCNNFSWVKLRPETCHMFSFLWTCFETVIPIHISYFYTPMARPNFWMQQSVNYMMLCHWPLGDVGMRPARETCHMFLFLWTCFETLILMHLLIHRWPDQVFKYRIQLIICY